MKKLEAKEKEMRKQTTTKLFYNSTIPSDWELKKLGEALTLKRGYDLTGTERINGTVPVISSSGFNGFHNISMAKAPGIVMGRYGTVGEIFYIEEDFWPHNTTLYVAEFKLLNPLFAYYLLQSINYNTYSGKSAVPGINRNDLHIEKVLIPPLPEQKAIAHILSLMDTAINKNNLLIAKKELKKKWLMQNLLTGKKRLKGFVGEWKEARLGDITTNFSRRNKDLSNAKVYSVTNTSGFVLQSDHFEGKIAGDDLSNYKIIKKNEFAYNPARINVGSLAYFENEIGVISSLYVCFRTKKEILDYYLLQFLQIDHTKYRIETLGEGGVRVYLWYELFSKIKINLPSIEEQTAITQLLQAADKEIRLLKTKTGKLRAKKKWLMQVLLTGKKRLAIKN